MLLGEMGMGAASSPGDGGFCALGKGPTQFPPMRLSREEILRRTGDFTEGGNLFALFLMSMREFGFRELPRTTASDEQLAVNHTARDPRTPRTDPH